MNELAHQQRPDEGLRELALFAGAGGGILGGKLLGWRTVCAVELDPYAASVLIARQNDGILEAFPIWDDVCTFDGRPWRGIVDVVSGGFPCQDISVAKKNAEGLNGKRSGLWNEMFRVIGEIMPTHVYVENSPALTFRGGVSVISDLARLGYVGRWGTVGAGAVNSVCEGERLWIVASQTDCTMLESMDIQKYYIPYEKEPRRRQYSRAVEQMLQQDDYSRVKRDTYVVAAQMDRLKAIGNGQVPILAATAWRILTETMSK